MACLFDVGSEGTVLLAALMRAQRKATGSGDDGERAMLEFRVVLEGLR